MGPDAARESLRTWDPERIGSFAVIGRLGAGAMGQVYLGRSASGRLVAVKTIKVELAEEPGFRRLFAQEVAAARRVSGMFTASVVDADPEADLPWLATAYVAAPTLNTLVQACGPMPVAAVRWLAAGCAEAVDSIHRAGLVHRDLKPSNVLVAPDGPRVIDFGLARAAERIEFTLTQGAVGTPAYMAPEQARDTRQATSASDIYALGATLVYAATGHPPYHGATVTDVLVQLATEPPDLDGLPGELAELVTACMQRIPRIRPGPTAILAHLGPFTEPTANAVAHPYLPGRAMAILADYERRPKFAAQPENDQDSEVTSASYTALPGVDRPRAPRQRRLLGLRLGRRLGPQLGRRPSRTTLIKASLGAAATALVSLGVVLGMLLSDSPGPAARPPIQQNQPPPPGPLPDCTATPPVRGTPGICMQASQGQPGMAFVLEGTGFPARSRVTVMLTAIGPPPSEPILTQVPPHQVTVSAKGTFRYQVNARHEFFPGPFQLGLYTVYVAQHGYDLTARFRVVP